MPSLVTGMTEETSPVVSTLEGWNNATWGHVDSPGWRNSPRPWGAPSPTPVWSAPSPSVDLWAADSMQHDYARGLMTSEGYDSRLRALENQMSLVISSVQGNMATLNSMDLFLHSNLPSAFPQAPPHPPTPPMYLSQSRTQAGSMLSRFRSLMSEHDSGILTQQDFLDFEKELIDNERAAKEEMRKYRQRSSSP
jgi:hypothetical protein